ncbi:MAG: protein phosphatase 2C domain-containing protein [Planctomycetota bacterium]|nr:protein phosphatase 2C domain-containing protein [Planctomycetota bacterium]
MTNDSQAAPRLHLTWHGRSVVGCVRKNNEDSLWAGPLAAAVEADTEHDAGTDGGADLQHPGALLLVADGMGGAKAGEVASGMAVRIVSQEMHRRADGDEVADASQDALGETFSAAVERANELIRDEGASNPSRHGMGTTLTALWGRGVVGHIAHVGDSRAYLFRKGNLQKLTKDQSLVEKLLEDKIISPEEAQRMGARNIILQALGSEEELEVALYTVTLEPGDTLLLCTDGLTGVVDDDDLEEALRRGGEMPDIADRLIKAAEDGGGPDNITVLLGHVKDAHRAS